MANTAAKKEPAQVHLLPEGRLINESLFEKDVFTDARGKEGTPQYKVEIAFDPEAVTGEGTIEDALIAAACKEWGDTEEVENAFLDGKIRSPFLSGDNLAAKREAKGKEGDAYKGKLVLRMNTIYNKDGQDAPGGIQVFAPDVSEIGIANRSEIYPGCYGQAAGVIHCYLGNDGERALKFYLNAFQKTKDGERLIAQRDHSTLFKPVGRDAGGESTGRRSRRG